MAFILLLLLSVASISSVELRTASNHMDRLQAEQNARLGFMIGLGELQKQLGPDQRISAPGSQRLSDTDTSARKHWTGVFDSWSDSITARPQPNFRRWLLSGSETVLDKVDTVSNGASLASSLVTLVPAEFDGNVEVSGAVEAGLEPVADLGDYAWWVGDENIKAQLGNRLDAPANPREASGQLMSAPRAAHEFFLGTGVAPGSPVWDRLLVEGQYRFINPGLDLDGTPSFHDYTLHAYGMVTDVRSGGFRKDLSLLLQQPLASLEAELGDPLPPLYTTNGVDGFNFFELWRDFNVWGEIQYLIAPPSHEDGNLIASETPFLVAEPTPTAAANDPFLAYKHITQLKCEIIFSLIAEEDGATGKYDLYLVADPIFTIWNPSNIALQIPDSVVSTFKVWRPPYDLTLYLDGVPQDVELDKVLSPNFVSGKLGKSQDTVIRPGEVQIQSQGFGATMQKHKGIDIKFFSAGIGWENGSGYKVLLDDFTGLDGSTEVTFKMDRNDSALHYGLVMLGNLFGEPPYGSHVQYGSHVIGDTIPNTIRATNYPEMFPGIPLDPSYSISVSALSVIDPITNSPQKWPLSIFSFGAKTESDPNFSGLPGERRTGRSLLRFNPATYRLKMNMKDDADIELAFPWQVGMRPLTSLGGAIEMDVDGLGYFGGSYGAGEGVSNLVAYTIAESPIHSLGAAQNFVPDGRGKNWDDGHAEPTLIQAIGNSFAPSVIPSSATSADAGDITYADHSYLANEALWDDYFFSSIDPFSQPAYKNSGAAYSEQLDRLEAFVGLNGAPSVSLPNGRFHPFPEDDPAGIISTLFSGAQPRSDAYEKVGANLTMDGMFNVNSTSVEAWKAVIGGLKGLSMPVRPVNGISATATLTEGSSSTSNAVVAAGTAAAGGEIDPATLSNPADPAQWVGFRTLSDLQIGELATEIVEQVRLRGPFLSLADFVNRRISTDPNVAVSGVLQTALDNPAVSINSAYRTGGRSLSLANAQSDGFPFPEAEAGVKSVAAPGYVDQADILTSLGPLLSVRSDTFTIRSYGDRQDASGDVESRVYVEAIVERIPDFVDSSVENFEDVSNLSKINETFGRKFRVVSFRIIDPDDLS
ncbi:hypothetical protein [Puniceicoccus vermicola]|uniref:Uncharacterized protein n=1 Tax=Puniceicoccus vermicola TaxID=388746 RepID=A0A7X1B2G3_9BACT|nr:hypothetical protein [Puniceicoccus vermicola]MBC2604420.1 hypothetical protein [Puniceicoccus vermicola]